VALNPTYYWPFNDTAGSTTVADVMGVHNLTSLVSDGLGVVGPELNTTANQLFSDQIWTGPQWGVGGWASWSMLALVNSPQAGALATLTDFMGIGDPANRHTRGVWLQQSSGAVNTLLYTLRGTVNSTNIAFNNVIANWRLLAWTFQLSPALWTSYADGVSSSTNAATAGVAPVATDSLWIQSAAPIVVSHVAWFPRVLSQTEVQTVSNQKVAWPYQQPINLPYTIGGGGTVDLTPVLDQTTQILDNQSTIDPVVQAIKQDTTNVLGHWTGYETVTLPSLNDVLSNITAGITATIGAGSSAIAQTIGQLFSWKPWDWFAPRDLSGGEVCEQLDVDVSLEAYYGITLRITQYPESTIFRTPDQAWSYNDLAVITFRRSGDIIARHGVHTLSHSVAPLPQSLAPTNVDLPVSIQPGDYHIIVDPEPGVCFTLTGYVLP